MRPRVLGVGLGLSLLVAAPPALANGRFPAAGQIAVDPTDPAHIVVRATYGILTTRDATLTGATWSWICETAVGFGGFEDPMMVITADGSLLAGVFDGLSISHDGGCQWDFVKDGLEDRYAIDTSLERADPASAVVLVSNSAGDNMFLTQVWQSSNNGATWTQAGTDLPSPFLGITLDTAPSDPKRVYASGRYGAPDYPGVLERSSDRGGTWETFPIADVGDSIPYIAAIDPANPDLLYMRVDADPADSLLVSTDGGETWSTAFQGKGSLLGFALSPDGATVAIGGEDDGLWTAPASTLEFTKVSDVGVRCLTWTTQALYACASEFVDGFEVGLSLDEGKTFSPLMHLQELCGPLACDPGTKAGKECPSLWSATQLAIGATCGAAADAGVADAGTAASTSGGSGGCACDVPGSAGGGAGLSSVLVGLAALAGRRLRRRGNLTH